MDGIVDTGAVVLVLPQNVVERLGLKQRRTVIVTYADGRKEERPVAGPITVQIAMWMAMVGMYHGTLW